MYAQVWTISSKDFGNDLGCKEYPVVLSFGR